MLLIERMAKADIETQNGNKWPCLIAKPGTNLPNCHEKDYCECEVESAYLRGVRAGIELAAQACMDYAHSGKVSMMRRQVAYACERRVTALLTAPAKREGESE